MALPAVGSLTITQRPIWVGIPRAKCPNGDGCPRIDVDEETLRRLRMGLKAVAVIQMIEVLDAEPTVAIDRNWKPRRHRRRLGEANTTRPILETHGTAKEKTPHFKMSTPTRILHTKTKAKWRRSVATKSKPLPRVNEVRLESKVCLSLV